MKNKHLVFLFLAVAALGLFARLLPLRYRPFFRGPLFRMEISALDKIAISTPGQPDLVLQQTDYLWMAEQAGRTLLAPTPEVTRRLQALASIRHFESVKTTRPDTLGFGRAAALQLRLYRQNTLVEHIEIGSQAGQNGLGHTYLRLPGHGGIYKVDGAIRTLFLLRLRDLRPAAMAPIGVDSIRRFGIQWRQEPPVFFVQPQPGGRWQSAGAPERSMSADSVRAWLHLFQQLDNKPFAGNFDESQADQTLYATIYLEATGGAYLSFRFYALQPPDTPEDISDLRAQGLHSLPRYVVHSSRHTNQYFAIPDTALVHRICSGLLPDPGAPQPAPPAQ
ncbi:MAG: hypothetical protein IPH12_07760 [Saprospirales bacterium]|nr:hypothetical protein [Saprospirales bacterium]MBK8920734.1 hypothetical protein [Saprospirales bacterium]